jgi:hypothetical protein
MTMSPVGRACVVAGAVAVLPATALRWVTVQGLPLDLGLLRADITATHRSVDGWDTAAWPVLLGVAGLTALLGLSGRLRGLATILGLAVTVAGGALLYYLHHVIDIETSDRSELERRLAHTAITSSVGPGPYLLLGAGVLIVLGALTGPRDRRDRPPTGAAEPAGVATGWRSSGGSSQ